MLRSGLMRLRYLIDGLFLTPSGGIAPDGTLRDCSGLVDSLLAISENRLGHDSGAFGRARVSLFPNEHIEGRPKKILDAEGQRGGLVAVEPGDSPQSQRMPDERREMMNVQNAVAPVGAKSIFDSKDEKPWGVVIRRSR